MLHLGSSSRINVLLSNSVGKDFNDWPHLSLPIDAVRKGHKHSVHYKWHTGIRRVTQLFFR